MPDMVTEVEHIVVFKYDFKKQNTSLIKIKPGNSAGFFYVLTIEIKQRKGNEVKRKVLYWQLIKKN